MSENVNGLKGLEALRTFLEEDGWFPRESKTDTIFFANYSGKNGRLSCEARIRVDVEIFIFYAEAPISIPEEKRIAVAEYMARVNFGMRIGNMEMDMSDGQVRYKSSLDFEGEKLTSNLLKNSILPAVTTMDRYLPGLMAIVYGGKSAATAYEDVRSNS